MRPIRPGARGPAVADIQRRLRTLGYNLGRAGVDGLFYGATAKAVTAFQEEHGVDERGFVGDATWSALVDATFTLGDRMLYLRMPHLHGRDVQVLQEALNTLGFACGDADGIFGAFSERAVRDFQRNGGLPADGIVGQEMVKALTALKHVWYGKEHFAHSQAKLAPARAAEALATNRFLIFGDEGVCGRVASRMVNLSHATSNRSLTELKTGSGPTSSSADVVLRISERGTVFAAPPGCPVVVPEGEMLVARLLAAVSASASAPPEVIVEIDGEVVSDERAEQRAAVMLLDALCAAFG